jgi:hypothetical protein
MLVPSQEYFLVGFLSLLIGLTVTRRFRLWIVCLILCILLASVLALFLADLLDPLGKPTPEFWARAVFFGVLVVFPMIAGFSIVGLIRPPKPPQPLT